MTTEERHQHYLEVINPQLDDLGRLICEASAMEDDVLGQLRYQDLCAFYEEQVGLGYWHPALTEPVADFTAVHDAAASLPFYRLALDQARSLDDDTHTILISMAGACFELGQTEQAEACLRDGRAEALQREDHESVETADALGRKMST